jgi:CDP-diacylglycerol---glycerol-3-phosphate 3-phosphatidyltransferase
LKLPNHLTLARLYLSLLFVILYSFHNVYAYYFGLVVYVIAAVTDYYDGKLARSYKIVSNFGKVMDPVADKVLTCSGYIILVQSNLVSVPALPVILILMREFFVMGLRTLKANEGIIMPAAFSGKLKTTFQLISIITILVIMFTKQYFLTFVPGFTMEHFKSVTSPLWLKYLFGFLNYTPSILIYLALIFTLYSAYDFFKHFKDVFNNE